MRSTLTRRAVDSVVCPYCSRYCPQRRDEDQTTTCPAMARCYGCYTDSSAHRCHRTPFREYTRPTPLIESDVLPPTYGLHATQPISSDHLITPYLSRITPSTSYLADPLNAYAHLGMPKPFVHLVGPPLGVALDALQVGNEGRFVRSGCRPNAVLRPMLCKQKGEETLGFGVFALRDLNVGEEIVLGWEWDDGDAVHTLPALLKTRHMFP